jgi:hypothetical protein
MTPGPALLTGIEEHQGLARKALQLVEQWALVVARRLDVLVVEVNRQQERTLIGQGDAMPGEEEQGDVAPCSGFSRSGRGFGSRPSEIDLGGRALVRLRLGDQRQDDVEGRHFQLELTGCLSAADGREALGFAALPPSIAARAITPSPTINPMRLCFRSQHLEAAALLSPATY